MLFIITNFVHSGKKIEDEAEKGSGALLAYFLFFLGIAFAEYSSIYYLFLLLEREGYAITSGCYQFFILTLLINLAMTT